MPKTTSASTSPSMTIGDVIALLLVLAGVIRVLLLPSAPEQVVQGVLLAVAIVVWVIFRTVGGRAAAFWREFGLVLKPTTENVNAVTLVIVPDPTGQAAAEEIRTRHSVSDLAPTLALLDTSAKKPEDVLPAQMDSAKGVYSVWTEATHANPVVARALENWAWKHMEVPILIVNPKNTRHDHLNFRVISQEDAAPAQLLVQEIARTTQWIHLATKVHRWWFYTSAAFIIVLIMLVTVSVRFENVKRRLSARTISLNQISRCLRADYLLHDSWKSESRRQSRSITTWRNWQSS